jgi:DNA-binding beta-propeller fold protein YncE
MMIRIASLCCLGVVWLTAPASAQDAMQYPIDVATDDAGTIYVADRRLPGIWKLADGELTILARGTSTFRTPLNAIRCVSVGRDGTIYAGDSATREVFRVSPEGELTPLTNGGIGIPMDVAEDSSGNLYVTDTELHRVWRVSKEGGEPEEFAVVAGPRGIAVDEADHVWVLSLQAPQLRRFAPDGTEEVVVSEFVFEFPHQLVVSEETVVVSDGYGKCLWRVPRAGGAPEKWVEGDPFGNPVGLATLERNVLVADPRSPDPGGGLFSITPDGMVNRLWPASP